MKASGAMSAEPDCVLPQLRFPEINTLRACPIMPYHDPQRPFVNQWYASSEGANCASFNAMLTEAAQDRLEAEGGACIMYTHFGHGFVAPRAYQ